jgi:hypothetical protein
MKILNERCWYLPRWLEWLPRVEVEAPRGELSPQPATR